MRKHGLRAIGLCLMTALGIMAFAASAQAETNAHWNVNGSAINSTLKPEVKSVLENNDGALLFQWGSSAVKLLCTSMEFEEMVLLTNGGSLGFIKFSGCKIYIAGVEAPKCAPKSFGAALGTILTNRLKDLILLHNGEAEAYDEIVPDSAATDPEFVDLLLGESCSIGEEMPVYGKFVIKDANLEARVEKVTHLIEEGPSTALRVFGPLEEGTPAAIGGSANVSLAGAHAGSKWSGTPAEEGPPVAHWNVSGSAISPTLKPELKSELENADGALFTTLGPNAVKLLCTSMELEESVLLTEGGSSGRIKFAGCKTFLSGTESTKCVPKSSGAAEGVILTNLLKDSIVLVEGSEAYDLLEPDSAAEDPEFVDILLGETCSIGEEMPVYGKFVIKDANLEARVEKATHLIEEGPSTALRAFGPLEKGTPAAIGGSANVSLAGVHAGSKWSGTPAEESPPVKGTHWNVGGNVISPTLKPELKAELEKADGALLTTVGVNAVKVLCTSTELEEAALLAEGGSLGRIKFSGCITLIAGVETPRCKPQSSGAASGTILTNLLKDSIVLVAGSEAYDLLIPHSTGSDPEFVDILLGETCSIGEEMPIFGELVLKDSQGEARVEKVTHLIEEGPSTTLRVFEPLEFGTPATIDGSANVSLAGMHAGFKWSGAPS